MKISDIRDEMNHICERENVKKLPVTRLTELLVLEGLIAEKEQEGHFVKVPTEKGIEQGINVVDMVSERGNPYIVLMYPVNIQRLLVLHYIREGTQGENDRQADRVSESSWLTKKREQHAGAYMPWTDSEDNKLINEYQSGQFSIRDLTEIHGRTTGAIRARLRKLKLIQ